MKLMTVPQIEAILGKYGDTLIRVWLSLWGEPLLNPRLPALIDRCKQYEIYVFISTNLSLPMTDNEAEALIASGVDVLNLAIDGASQPVYEMYRRGGKLALVLENARKLVAAKKKLASKTPTLLWRYLSFPWNEHEIEAARKMAKKIGLDRFEVSRGVLTQPIRASLRPPDDEAGQRWAQGKAGSEWRRLAAERQEAHTYFGCDYLYQSISINANGDVHPCCYVVAPYDRVGVVTDSVEAVRDAPLLSANRRMFKTLQPGAGKVVAGSEPCKSCSVIAATDGHVITQSSFRELFEHLIGRREMSL